MNENISSNLQNGLIYLMITDTAFAKAVSGQVPEDFITTDEARLSYKIAVQYVNEFHKAPGNHFHDEVMKVTTNAEPEFKESLARYVYWIKKNGKPDRDYVLSRLNSFIRERKFTKAIYECAELTQRGELDKASAQMYEALKSGIESQNFGHRMLKDFTDVPKRGESPQYLMNLGIPSLDRLTGGLSRGELILLLGGYKGGKSWFATYIGCVALRAGLRVLHVSHENSQQECLDRYDMGFGALLKEKEPRLVRIPYMDGNVVKEIEVQKDTIYNQALVIKNRKMMMSKGGDIVIRKYPMGSCTPMEMLAYMEYLENFGGFVPDIVINDYADIMGSPNTKRETRDSLNEIYIQLKRIADEKQVVMVTLSQVNRDGLQSAYLEGKLGSTHVAEDIRKAGNIDRGYYFVKPREFTDTPESIVGCWANRNGAQDVSCVIGQSIAIGQFHLYDYLETRDKHR